MLYNSYHPSGYLYQLTYEGCTLHSLQLNLEGGQLFFLTEDKFPHWWPGYCHRHLFSLEVVAVLMMVHPFSDLSSVTFGTEKYEYKSNFLFLIGAGISG